MARIRTVKPEFWTDSKIVALTPLARLVYIAMWNFADDYGVLEDDVIELKLRIAPNDDIDMTAIVDELAGSGRIRRATNKDGTAVLLIPRFTEHQRINRPSNPRHGYPDTFTYPSRSTHTPLTEGSVSNAVTSENADTHGALTEPSPPEGKGREGNPPTPRDGGEPSPPPDRPGGTAAPPTPTPIDPAGRVLDRVTGSAPAAVAERLRADLNGTHHRLVAAKLADGWKPGHLADRLTGRGWDGVAHPAKALLARIRQIGPAPPDHSPPPIPPPSPDDRADPDSAAPHIAAIRQQLEPEDDP